jgi:hypothetical protein
MTTMTTAALAFTASPEPVSHAVQCLFGTHSA